MIKCWCLIKLVVASQCLQPLPIKFCHGIGFNGTCTITLKTEIDSTRSWQVHGATYKTYGCMLGDGWKSFCRENRLKTGDLCTFHIVETTLWHVTIKRCKHRYILVALIYRDLFAMDWLWVKYWRTCYPFILWSTDISRYGKSKGDTLLIQQGTRDQEG